MALTHTTYPEIKTRAPNGKSREDKPFTNQVKKKSQSQGCQLHLNLRPESWQCFGFLLTVRFAYPSFSLGPGFVSCCNICNGASSEMVSALHKIQCFLFNLLIFPVSHPANMTAVLGKSLPPSTAVTASLYTSSSILAASHQARIYVKTCIIHPSVDVNKI
jgi:hypothetical protein